MSRSSGERDIVRALNRLGSRAPSVIGSAIFAESTNIFIESQNQVPVDTGFLKSSGYITPPSYPPNHTTVEIGYTAPYATEVHENMNARHSSPTKSKYLTDPMNAAASDFRRKVMQRLKVTLGL